MNVFDKGSLREINMEAGKGKLPCSTLYSAARYE